MNDDEMARRATVAWCWAVDTGADSVEDYYGAPLRPVYFATRGEADAYVAECDEWSGDDGGRVSAPYPVGPWSLTAGYGAGE